MDGPPILTFDADKLSGDLHTIQAVHIGRYVFRVDGRQIEGRANERTVKLRSCDEAMELLPVELTNAD